MRIDLLNDDRGGAQATILGAEVQFCHLEWKKGTLES